MCSMPKKLCDRVMGKTPAAHKQHDTGCSKLSLHQTSYASQLIKYQLQLLKMVNSHFTVLDKSTKGCEAQLACKLSLIHI